MDSTYREHGFFGPVSGPYTRFDVSGVKQTAPVASNSAVQIAGYWMDSANVLHGFLRNTDGAVVNGAVPGSRMTDPQESQLLQADRWRVHRFLERAPRLYPERRRRLYDLHFPAGKTNASVRINDAGVVAGYYYGSDYVFTGYVRATNGTISTFTMPGTRTSVAGINQAGSIVGGYGGANGLRRDFLRRPDGATVSLEYPGANTIHSTTFASAINQSGVIIGHYQINTITNTVTHGFILTGAQ
jgi:hypothetical protein